MSCCALPPNFKKHKDIANQNKAFNKGDQGIFIKLKKPSSSTAKRHNIEDTVKVIKN